MNLGRDGISKKIDFLMEVGLKLERFEIRQDEVQNHTGFPTDLLM